MANNQGAALTSRASWSYYGERSAVRLLGPRASLPYKILFLGLVFLGSVLIATNVLAFGDLMILGMAFPNLIGVYYLSGKLRGMLDDYWSRYKAGSFQIHR